MQRLILFALCITITSAEVTINFFNGFQPETSNNRSTIYANYVQLWANVTGCPQSPCECTVKIDESEDEPQTLEFNQGKEDLGTVDISNLEADTNYTVTLTCEENKSAVSRTLTIKTDYGRPEAPDNITASVVAEDVQITWSFPPISNHSFTNYKIKIDKKIVASDVSKTATSFKIINEHKDGAIHTVYIATCYINNQKQTVCSELEDAKATFLAPIPETSPPPTPTPIPTAGSTTTPKSYAGYSYSISLTTIISTLLFMSQME